MLLGSGQSRPPAVPSHVARGRGRMTGHARAGRRAILWTRRSSRAFRLAFAFLAGSMLVAFTQLATFEPQGETVPPPAIYRPAGDRGGCTQAPIDRANGQTTPVE